MIEINDIVLVDKNNNEDKYFDILCGNILVGSLIKVSQKKWEIYSLLPHTRTYTVCGSKERAIIITRDMVTNFINNLIKTR